MGVTLLTIRLDPHITEELYFSYDRPAESFNPRFSVRAKSEEYTSASKHLEKSQLKGMVLEKADSIKKPTTAAVKKDRKEKVKSFEAEIKVVGRADSGWGLV